MISKHVFYLWAANKLKKKLLSSFPPTHTHKKIGENILIRTFPLPFLFLVTVLQPAVELMKSVEGLQEGRFSEKSGTFLWELNDSKLSST